MALNNQDSVPSWIQEWEWSDDNHIVFYKLHSQLEEEVALEKDDFVVIMHTEFQKHLMQEIGSKGSCCETTHGTIGYDFKLNYYLHWMNLKKEYQ